MPGYAGCDPVGSRTADAKRVMRAGIRAGAVSGRPRAVSQKLAVDGIPLLNGAAESRALIADSA